MLTANTTYRTAHTLGSMVAMHEAAANPRHAHHAEAVITLNILAADRRGETWALGARLIAVAGFRSAAVPEPLEPLPV